MTQELYNSSGQGPLSYQFEVITTDLPNAPLSPATYLIADNSPKALCTTLQASYKYTNALELRKGELHSAFWEANGRSEALISEWSSQSTSPELLEDWNSVAREAVKNPATHIPSGLLEDIFQDPVETPEIQDAIYEEEFRRFEHDEAVTNLHCERSAREVVLTERDRLNKRLRIASIATGVTGGIVTAGGLVEVISSQPSQDQLMNETAAETRLHEQVADVGAVIEVSGLALALAAAAVYGCRNRYARHVARKLVS